MFRLLRTILTAITILLLLWFLLGKAGIIPDIREVFRSKPVKIDDTPLLVNGIRELAQLVTMTAHDEVVADSTVIDPTSVAIRTITGLGPDPAHLVLVAKGRVTAGTDLSGLGPSDIYREKDSVSLGLPAARILEITVNPGDVETFIESGKWSTDAFEAVKIKAREKMRVRAMEQGILSKADDRAVMIMENFLRQSGFSRVHVFVRRP
jgi:hypothetical protein